MAKPPDSASESPSASASASETPTLTLSASHFAKLAPSSFLAAHLPGSRPSQRSPLQARPPTLNVNSLTHAHGSAVVRLGDTAVVCGVRGEVLRASDTNAATVFRDETAGSRSNDAAEIADRNLLVPNIELATGASPAHLPGNPPSALAQSLTHRLLTLLRMSDLVRFGELQIWARGPDGEKGDAGEARRRRAEETKGGREADMDMDQDDEDEGESLLRPQLMAFWTLYIDILVISLDGSPFDAAWAAVLGALRNTKLPDAWWDRDLETVLCDPRPDHVQRLSLQSCPVALTFAAFNPPLRVGSKRSGQGDVHVLMDPDDFEESCCNQMITVVVDQNGSKVMRIEMSGGDLLDPGDMKKLIKRAAQRWEEWKFVLESA